MKHFIIVLNHSVFHWDRMWKSIYFKLNNTIILYKNRKVFNGPQEMSNFVDLTKYFNMRPKHQVHPTRGQQCVWFYQKWMCILQHRIYGSHLIIMSRFTTNQDRYTLTGESFYNNPGSLQNEWELHCNGSKFVSLHRYIKQILLASRFHFSIQEIEIKFLIPVSCIAGETASTNIAEYLQKKRLCENQEILAWSKINDVPMYPICCRSMLFGSGKWNDCNLDRAVTGSQVFSWGNIRYVSAPGANRVWM